MLSVVVTLCHLVTLDPQSKPLTACFERIAGRIEIGAVACPYLLPGAVQWKESGQYAGNDYYIGGVRCEGGNYEIKDDL